MSFRRSAGAGTGDEAEFELHPHVVGVATRDTRPAWRFLVVSDEHPVSGFRIERPVRRTGTVADPGLDDQISTDARCVVPQVVQGRVHVVSLA